MSRENGRYIVPNWCKEVCVNSGTITCEYECAGKRDARFFVADPEITLEEAAPFPTHDWTWNMSAKERQACAGLYLEKMTEAITGIQQNPADERRKRKMMAAVKDESIWKLVTELSVIDSEDSSAGSGS